MNERKVVVITGASSGFGNLTARALARVGHTVYAGMRASTGRNAGQVAQLAELSAAEAIDVRGIEMDVADQDSVDAAIGRVLADQNHLDVVVHNAGHMATGPAEAFTPEQLIALYDVNVVSTQRVNRAVLPHLRARGQGLLVWVASTSTRGGHPPFLAPYFAATAAMDALAESYAAELIKFGIDTVIVTPGAYPTGTNHFTHADTPADSARAADYDEAYGSTRRRIDDNLVGLFPAGHDAAEVADEITRVIDLPAGRRPLRTHVDPSRDGSEVVSAVADRIRAEFYHRIGIADLLPSQAHA